MRHCDAAHVTTICIHRNHRARSNARHSGVHSLASSATAVLAPEIARDFGLPAKLVGVFVGLLYVGSMTATLASGHFIARHGAIRVSQLCVLICAAGTLRLLRREHPVWHQVRVRSSKYLNDIIEQDHRAIKRRCASMKGFKSFANAAVTIAGIELAHRIHKHQFSFRRGRPRKDRSLRADWEHAVA
jgi:hypothetical protein